MGIQQPATGTTELGQVIDERAVDPKEAKESLAILIREREELRQKIGTIEVAVDLVRDARDQ